jgi:hypothetical protein
MYTLGHARQEHESSVEQAALEDATNIFPEQGKLQYIPPISLEFWFQSIFTLSLIVH